MTGSELRQLAFLLAKYERDYPHLAFRLERVIPHVVTEYNVGAKKGIPDDQERVGQFGDPTVPF